MSEFDRRDVPLWRGRWPAENKKRQVAHREGKTVSLHRMKTERQLQRRENSQPTQNENRETVTEKRNSQPTQNENRETVTEKGKQPTQNENRETVTEKGNSQPKQNENRETVTEKGNS